MPRKKLGSLPSAMLWLTVLCAAAVGWFYWSFPETILRYRLTADFRVDGKLVSGTGVWQVKYQPRICSDHCTTRAKLTGDAIPIELGPKRGTLWILLRQRNDARDYQFELRTKPEWIVPYLFGHSPFSPPSFPKYVRGLREIHGTVHPTLKQLPQMVILPNDELPTKYQWVGTGPGGVDLGPLPEFVGASITVTDEPPTTGIRTRLSWLDVKLRPVFALSRSESDGLVIQDFEEIHP
ncbi:hypothetical protein [Pararhizobium sp. PWRC1-1]|uniref:hypothetical protein n=1 Tax=Pararhizobium sp. PWRC1-1 TaxID=2804566 RepID=UPI003CEE34E8